MSWMHTSDLYQNHCIFSITFERYCSEIVLKRENFGWQVHVYILQNCSEKFYDARNWN